MYVLRSIFDKFVAALKIQAEALKLGAPHEEGTDIGPLISHKHREKVVSYFQIALDEGATIVTGNSIPEFDDEKDGGAFVLPTIWTGLKDESRIMQEEIFGPVCHISVFDDDAEVIERVNNSHYGLVCSLWTSNVGRAHRVAGQIHTGIVWVNTWFARDLRTPFGGVKASGIGREGGQYSLDFFSEITNISVKY